MTAVEVLRKYWGFDKFRPLQDTIISSVLEGKDTLGLLPTGGGKSVCYQVPALMQEGVCLVISPLIALMKDQVMHLKKQGISAIALFSGMHYKDIDIALDNAVYGKYKFLFLSPERLLSDIARERIKKMKVNLIAVDEAHCISQWGYDFRPPYLEVANIREFHPNIPIIALTATATEKVIIDIQEKLAFKKMNVFKKSFQRENLHYVVLHEEDKLRKLKHILDRTQGSGIVYVRNRKKTRNISEFLRQNQIQADFYHAGLKMEERDKKQTSWQTNKTRIMVCTNAFGMGIDKPDVRTVVHMDLPDSLEAYYQEAGRAGRDGKKAYPVLLFNDRDRLELERQFLQSFPDFKTIRRVYQALGSYYQLGDGGFIDHSLDFDLIQFSRNFEIPPLVAYQSLKVLEQSGWLALTESINSPAQFKFIVSKTNLYDYQLRNPQHDIIIKTLLRTYQGAFLQFTKLHESKISFFLKMRTDLLIEALQRMQLNGILEYVPHNEKPQILMLKERVPAKNLSIDYQLYQYRKVTQREKLDRVIAYARTAKCRSQLLVEYFGELDSEPCGKCDVCLGRTKVNVQASDIDTYEVKIQKLLLLKPLEVRDLLDHFASHRKDKVIAILDELVDRGRITIIDEKLTWK